MSKGQAGSATNPPAASAPAKPGQSLGKAGKNKAAKRHAAEQTAPPVVEAASAAPPAPDWPANDKAQPASVAWDGRDLSIAASNASLQQILRDVSTATGVKVEGMSLGSGGVDAGGGRDQRIYGSYGPGPARDVLSQLLDGSGYNVIMIGDRGAGTPRTLVLTAQAKSAPGAMAAQPSQSSDEEVPEEPEPPEAQPEAPQRRPFMPPPNGQPQRTPQQVLQEIQQRQQQMQQQQGNPQQQPN
jgi:hypothetical protein